MHHLAPQWFNNILNQEISRIFLEYILVDMHCMFSYGQTRLMPNYGSINYSSNYIYSGKLNTSFPMVMITYILIYEYRPLIIKQTNWKLEIAAEQQLLLGNFFVHDDVIKWKHIPHYWSFVQGIHQSLVNSLHKGQCHGALMFSLICAWINGWANNHEAGDLRCHCAHYDVTVITNSNNKTMQPDSCNTILMAQCKTSVSPVQ